MQTGCNYKWPSRSNHDNFRCYRTSRLLKVDPLQRVQKAFCPPGPPEGGEGVTATSSTFPQPDQNNRPACLIWAQQSSSLVQWLSSQHADDAPLLSTKQLCWAMLVSWAPNWGSDQLLGMDCGISGERRHPSEFPITAFKRVCATFNHVGTLRTRWNS